MCCHLEGKFFGGGGGVFWEIHIHLGGGILGNSHTFWGGGYYGHLIPE